MKRVLLLGLVLILSACATPQESTPAPTPSAMNVIFPHALKPWADKIASCAGNDPQAAVYFLQSEQLESQVGPNDIILVFGNLNRGSDGIYLSQVGWDQVVVIVNKDNPLPQLSIDELMSVFAGHTTDSDVVPGSSPQIWVLPGGESTRLIFDQAVMQNQLISTDAMLAPDPGAMLESVSQNPDAIGYLPTTFITTGDPTMTAKVRIIQLEPSLEDLLHQPVVAITQHEPVGLMRNLLVCLESSTP